MSRILGFLLLTAAVSGSMAGAEEAPKYIARFRDREINLEPFLQGYPYSRPEAELEFGHLRYFDTQPDGKWLRTHHTEGEEEVDLASGHRVGIIDWSTRSWSHSRYHPPSGLLYLVSDEQNDEHLNIYTLDPRGESIQQITDNDYTYGWSFSDDYHLLAYIPRAGLNEPFSSSLRIRDLETGEDREILSDRGGADRFTWSQIIFTPAKDRAILAVQHDGDRNTTSLAQILLEDPSFDYLIPPRKVRYGLDILRKWVSETEFLYLSSESGFRNLCLFDLNTRQSRQITEYGEDIRTARLLAMEPPLVLVAIRRPHETEIQVLDARSGRVHCREIIDAAVGIMDVHQDRGIFSISQLTVPLRMEHFIVRETENAWTLERSLLAAMPLEVAAEIVHCAVDKVEYPTFDTLDDGTRRMLHAFYLEPKMPPTDRSQRRVLITAFYGGGNRYSEKTHILGAAGIASFSPAPRGSWGYGAEFAALNDQDLGGDEIVDIIYAAKWLVEEKGYEPHQIGVHGGSHGGYATLRALTFPPETNDRNEHFEFGFGMSHAGFSDIHTFYESCNIPDWVILEAGNPATEAAKLMDRSPINHVERLQAPVLLTHGKNDWRVPVTESRRFAEKARALGKPVTYVEFQGQGHGIGGLQNKLDYYQAIFSFLESI